jgi:hypothetical protein
VEPPPAEQGACGALEVDGAVLVEPVVLDRQDGLLHHRRDLVQRDGNPVLVVEGRERGAGGVDDPGLLGKGLHVELGRQVGERVRALACRQAERCCDGQDEAGDQHSCKAADTDDQQDAPQRSDGRVEAEGPHGSRVKGTVNLIPADAMRRRVHTPVMARCLSAVR